MRFFIHRSWLFRIFARLGSGLGCRVGDVTGVVKALAAGYHPLQAACLPEPGMAAHVCSCDVAKRLRLST